MAEPNNGAVLGSGERSRPASSAPEIEVKDQFEQEGAEIIDETDDVPPAHTVAKAPVSPADHRGDPERLKDVSAIMNDLTSANLGDLRITNIALDLNGTQKLKISFGNAGRPEKKGRVLTLYTRDGTWAYEA